MTSVRVPEKRADRLLEQASVAVDQNAVFYPGPSASVYLAAPLLRLRYGAVGSFAYQPITDTLQRLSPLSAWLLQELDGVVPLAELASRAIAAGLSADADELENCLESLRRSGFVRTSERRAVGARIPVEDFSRGHPLESPNGAPLFAFWEPTLRCNLRCESCYNNSGPKAPDGVDRADVAAALADAGVLRVTLLGGEPMMMPDFFPLISKLESAGICVEFVTNGWFLTERLLRPLLATRVTQFMVSVDGDGATNDRLRGRSGAFARALDGIRLYASQGFAITGSLTLMSSNIGEMESVIGKLVDAGVRRIKVRPLVPEGRGQNCFGDEGLDRDAFERCCETLRDIVNSLPNTVDLLLVIANRDILRDGVIHDHEIPLDRALSESGLDWDTFYVRYDGKICRSSFERNVILGDILSDFGRHGRET